MYGGGSVEYDISGVDDVHLANIHAGNGSKVDIVVRGPLKKFDVNNVKAGNNSTISINIGRPP
jgi:hypothetical protein